MSKVLDKFTATYPRYVEAASADGSFGFDLETVARLSPVFAFLYRDWWHVDCQGLDRLPKEGPALIVGNSGSVLPWPALMLMYALLSDSESPRKLNILAEMSWIEDERLYHHFLELGFVPFSADHAKKLFAAGEIVAIFPEGVAGLTKPFSERYRLRPFDWTAFLPAVRAGVPVFPLATLGCDESVPVIGNLEGLARFLKLPAFPVTPFFPWLPFPAYLASLPVPWKMHLLKECSYEKGAEHDEIEQAAQRLAEFSEGEVQAELNRMLRSRLKNGN